MAGSALDVGVGAAGTASELCRPADHEDGVRGQLKVILLAPDTMLSQLICVQSPIVVSNHQHNTTMSRYRAKRTQSFILNRRQAGAY